MNKVFGLMLGLLLLTLSLTAQSSLNPQFYQSTMSISYCAPGTGNCPLSAPAAGEPNAIYVLINASYFNVTDLSASAPGTTATHSTTQNFALALVPATNATITLTFDGQNLTDAAGNSICNPLVTAETDTLSSGSLLHAGEANCTATYAHNPNPLNSTPMPIANWSRCGLLQATLVSSGDDAKVKPSVSSILYCPPTVQSLGSFNLFKSVLSDPHNLAVCFPLFIVLGLLLSAMYYQGRNPLSLFDITTPRLPNVKKVKMKSATQPAQLAYKGRMSNRIISRAERSIGSQIGRLYRTAGADAASTAAARAAAVAMLPRKSDITKGASHGDAKAMEKNLKALQDIVDKSGASAAERARSMEVIRRMVQVREALAIDLAVSSAARSGGRPGLAKYNPRIEMVGSALAKPWVFALEKMGVPKEKVDWLPGIPYVERASLVATGWLSNRAGNITMRQSLRRSLAAETGKSLGLLTATSAYYQKHGFATKKMGEIPHIIERMRMLTHVQGKAVIDSHLQLLAEALYYERNEKGEVKINKKGVEELSRLIRENTSGGLLDKVALARALAEHIRQNKLSMYAPDGTPLSASDTQKMVRDFVDNYIVKAYAVLKEDDAESARKGVLPEVKAAGADGKLLNPNDVYKRYEAIVALIEQGRHADDWKAGRVPMVMLGRDIADVLGRALTNARLPPRQSGETDAQYAARTNRIPPANEGERLLRIRLGMEELHMRKSLFDTMINQLQGQNLYQTQMKQMKREDLQPLLTANGKTSVNDEWLKRVYSELSVQKLREKMDYTMRGEWAARDYLTAHKEITSDYSAKADLNRIILLRQYLAAQYDKGFENLFQTLPSDIEHSRLQYQSLKGLASFYLKDLPADKVNRANGEVVWDEKSYAAWKARGVRYEDVQKGAWIIGADKTIMPMASFISRDKDGRIIGAGYERSGMQVDVNGKLVTAPPKSFVDSKGRLTYDLASLSTLLMSDYAERPINGQFIFKDAKGVWRPGAPTTREVAALANKLKEYQEELINSRYGKLSGPAQAEEEARIRANITALQGRINDQVKFITRSSLIDDPKTLRENEIKIGANPLTRGIWKATQFAERVGRGGLNNVDNRLQEWYASQAYARLVLETFNRDWNDPKNKMLSEEVSKSMLAKEQLSEYRQREMELMRKRSLSADERKELNQLRSTDIPTQLRNVDQFEREARIANKTGFWADRDVKRVGDMYLPFFNVAELTVMRDPRIAFGGGHGLGPALMVGYQSGQMVGERTSMWAGYHLAPGDRVFNVLGKPAYAVAMAFSMSNRSFFSKMVGYTSIYHMDPEKGTGHAQEGGIMQSFQSIFRPSNNFDWFTRLYVKPMVRTKYKDEFGFSLKEEDSWAGERFVFPLSWKYGGGANANKARAVDSAYAVDEAKYNQMGLDVSEEMRRRKLGLTFREEYTLWDKRYAAQAAQSGQETLAALREQLRTATDSDERRMLKSAVREAEDTYQTDRKLWHVPIIGSFFRQGYYSVENRSGYDISAAGGAHRSFEMSNPWFKNTGKVGFPGMYYTDLEGHLQMFPRVARSIVNSDIPGSSLSSLVTRVRPDTEELNPGVGRDLRKDAIRDLFRHETPFFSKFLELEMERMSYSFSNSSFILPLAPIYMLTYQQLRKSAWGRKQPWSINTPTEGDIPFTEEDKRKEVLMRNAAFADEAKLSGHYRCPTHGISLSSGQMCPLCRTEEAATTEPTRGEKAARRLARTRENLKNLAESAVPFSGYTHYYNQAHCHQHGIAYDRGTACPLCLEDRVRKEGLSTDKAKDFLKEMTDYNARLRDTAKDRSLTDEQRTERMEQIYNEREAHAEDRFKGLERDKRMGYTESKEFIKAEMARIRKMEAEEGYRFAG